MDGNGCFEPLREPGAGDITVGPNSNRELVWTPPYTELPLYKRRFVHQGPLTTFIYEA